jgi:translation initiation factor IF-1
MEGEVVEAFRSGMYKVLLENGQETLGYTAGKMRRYRIKILPGDKINIELSPYDLSRGRIPLPLLPRSRGCSRGRVDRAPALAIVHKGEGPGQGA